MNTVESFMLAILTGEHPCFSTLPWVHRSVNLVVVEQIVNFTVQNEQAVFQGLLTKFNLGVSCLELGIEYPETVSESTISEMCHDEDGLIFHCVIDDSLS